ncbi:MAG: PEP-CTERM sorting domain-containing protein [Akkermansia sp.]|nr:PEP-CTERM sorting domain-containing protein [Akkermansia sp.]
MKMHKSALLALVMMGSSVWAEAVTETVVSNATEVSIYTTETDGSAYSTSSEQKPYGSSYGMRFKENLTATNSSFTTENGYDPYIHGQTGNPAPSGAMFFAGTVEASNCRFTAEDYTSGSIKFTKDVVLKGGNTFTSRSGQNINFQGTVTAKGDNTFIGGVSATNFVVQSGTQTFKREDNPSNRVNSPSQALTFSQIGFAEDADDSARIDISAVDVPTRTVNGYPKGGAFGAVRFGGNSEITSLEVNAGLGLYINGSLTVRETVVIGERTKVNFGTNGEIIFEIDSLSELMDQPMLYSLDGEEDLPMLSVADGVDMSEASISLLFTENALEELEAMEGPITLNLDKVTNVAEIDISLDVVDSFGKTAEAVFGTKTVKTGVYGSGDNVYTVAVPEPTTATLSLLGLMALAARRRRK